MLSFQRGGRSSPWTSAETCAVQYIYKKLSSEVGKLPDYMELLGIVRIWGV